MWIYIKYIQFTRSFMVEVLLYTKLIVEPRNLLYI
jgi:hypothetical protein